MTVRMTEAELARDVHAVLERCGKTSRSSSNRSIDPRASGRRISDVIAALEVDGASVVIDEDFARNVEDGIKSHREPWHPPSWD